MRKEEDGGHFRIPRVSLEAPLLNQRDHLLRQGYRDLQIEATVATCAPSISSIGNKVVDGEEKEAPCRMQPSPMLGMIRMSKLELQEDEPAGQLDQPLMEPIVRSLPSFLEPEMLQHIVRLVIALTVEALEITEVAGIKGGPFFCPFARFEAAQRSKELLHPLGFFRALCVFALPSARIRHHVSELRVAPG